MDWNTQKKVWADRTQTMRRKVFSLCWELGYIEKNMPSWERTAKVEAMVAKFGPLKPAGLSHYKIKDLPKLINVFEQMLRHNMATEARKAAKQLINETLGNEEV